MPDPLHGTNRLLGALPGPDRARLAPHFELIAVELKQVLFTPGNRIDSVYFPGTAVVSILTTMDDGTGVEIATVGSEAWWAWPYSSDRISCPSARSPKPRVPGEVMRMDAEVFGQEMMRRGALQCVVQRYVLSFFSQTSQQVACNSLHSIEQRSCRWLLLNHDCVGTDEFPLTQEFLSEMLGIRRASVTVVAGVLARSGFIHFSRGRRTIVDRAGLKAANRVHTAIVVHDADQ